MKKFLTFMVCMLACLTIQAKNPVVVQPTASETESWIQVINDSTIVYHHVTGIQVAQPTEVYTGIFEYNPYSKKKVMNLCIMNHGAYIWMTPEGRPGTYILYASKAFDRVILRAQDE